MRFAIRDDDTSFFTQPGELESLYSGIWDTCPISLAVIPFDVPTFHRGIPQKFYQTGDPVPVQDNRALVAFLKEGIESERFHIMLHGYNHRYKVTKDVPYDPQYWIPEFAYIESPEEKMRAGRQFLEKVFDVKVAEFVPPSNTMAAAALQVLGRVRLNLACVTGGRVLASASVFNLPRYYLHRLSRLYPFFAQQFVGHQQMACHSLTPSCDWDHMTHQFDDCAKKGGTFVVATHYWELRSNHSQQRSTLLELLDDLMERARSVGARFVTLGDVFAPR